MIKPLVKTKMSDIEDFKKRMNIDQPIVYIHLILPNAVKELGVPVNSTPYFIKGALRQQFYCKCCTPVVEYKTIRDQQIGRDRYLVLEDLLV